MGTCSEVLCSRCASKDGRNTSSFRETHNELSLHCKRSFHYILLSQKSNHAHCSRSCYPAGTWSFSREGLSHMLQSVQSGRGGRRMCNELGGKCTRFVPLRQDNNTTETGVTARVRPSLFRRLRGGHRSILSPIAPSLATDRDIKCGSHA